MFNPYPGAITAAPFSFSSISEDLGGNTFLTTALRIGGVSGPFHMLHMSDGNLYMEGSGEVGHIVKRIIDNVGTSGPLGDRTNPIFIDKRIGQAGDGDFEVKTLFQADEESERVIFKWDSKGIFATIGFSGLLGRQNEGYLQDGHVNPWYALNSEGSEHRLEIGPGGANDVDIAFTRTGTQTASIQVGANSTSLQSKMTFYADSIVPHQPITYPETTTPGNPSAGNYKTYFKSDGNFYKLDSSGTETEIGASGATGVSRYQNFPNTSSGSSNTVSPALDIEEGKLYRIIGKTNSSNLGLVFSNLGGSSKSYEYGSSVSGATNTFHGSNEATSSSSAASSLTMLIWEHPDETINTYHDITITFDGDDIIVISNVRLTAVGTTSKVLGVGHARIAIPGGVSPQLSDITVTSGTSRNFQIFS